MLQGEHSAILSTFIKLPFVIKIFVLSIFEWPLKCTQKPPLNADISSGTRGLIFGLNLHLHSYRTLCMEVAMALVSLCICTGLPPTKG